MPKIYLFPQGQLVYVGFFLIMNYFSAGLKFSWKLYILNVIMWYSGNQILAPPLSLLLLLFIIVLLFVYLMTLFGLYQNWLASHLQCTKSNSPYCLLWLLLQLLMKLEAIHWEKQVINIKLVLCFLDLSWITSIQGTHKLQNPLAFIIYLMTERGKSERLRWPEGRFSYTLLRELRRISEENNP